MKALKCDRCGNLYETYSEIEKPFYITTSPFMSHCTLDLCPECNKELKYWFAEKKIKRLKDNGNYNQTGNQ